MLAGSAVTLASTPPSGTSIQADTLMVVVGIPTLLASAQRMSRSSSTAAEGVRRPKSSFATVKIVAGNGRPFFCFGVRAAFLGLWAFRRAGFGRRGGPPLFRFPLAMEHL